jgi:hypothetical protein
MFHTVVKSVSSYDCEIWSQLQAKKKLLITEMVFVEELPEDPKYQKGETK